MHDIAAQELKLYIENDSELYENLTTPTMRNLERKKQRGSYDRIRAHKAFRNLADNAAKAYIREHGTWDQPKWHQVFPPATRNRVALSMLHEFEKEYALGNTIEA